MKTVPQIVLTVMIPVRTNVQVKPPILVASATTQVYMMSANVAATEELPLLTNAATMFIGVAATEETLQAVVLTDLILTPMNAEKTAMNAVHHV